MKKVIRLTEQDINNIINEVLDEINHLSQNSKVTVTSIDDFKIILSNLNINDRNVEDFIGKYAFIEIGNSKNYVQAKYTTFPTNNYNKDNWEEYFNNEQFVFDNEHTNVCKLVYDDILNPVKGDKYQNIPYKSKGIINIDSEFKSDKGFKYKGVGIFDDNIKNKLISFVNNNIKLGCGKTKFIIHCRQGKFRSYSIGLWISKLVDKNVDKYLEDHSYIDSTKNKIRSQFNIGKNRFNQYMYGQKDVLNKLGDSSNLDSDWYKEDLQNYIDKHKIFYTGK